jgi:hypothetical protein
MQLARRNVFTTTTVVVLSLLFAHLPNTSAPASTYCIGPAAYPPDLPDCLDPVVEAQKEAKRVADEQKAAADAAALKARQDKEEQDAIALSVAAAKSQADFAAAAAAAVEAARKAQIAKEEAETAAAQALARENTKKDQIAAAKLKAEETARK